MSEGPTRGLESPRARVLLATLGCVPPVVTLVVAEQGVGIGLATRPVQLTWILALVGWLIASARGRAGTLAEGALAGVPSFALLCALPISLFAGFAVFALLGATHEQGEPWAAVGTLALFALSLAWPGTVAALGVEVYVRRQAFRTAGGVAGAVVGFAALPLGGAAGYLGLVYEAGELSRAVVAAPGSLDPRGLERWRWLAPDERWAELVQHYDRLPPGDPRREPTRRDLIALTGEEGAFPPP